MKWYGFVVVGLCVIEFFYMVQLYYWFVVVVYIGDLGVCFVCFDLFVVVQCVVVVGEFVQMYELYGQLIGIFWCDDMIVVVLDDQCGYVWICVVFDQCIDCCGWVLLQVVLYYVYCGDVGICFVQCWF